MLMTSFLPHFAPSAFLIFPGATAVISLVVESR
jgi:hypothetical protein